MIKKGTKRRERKRLQNEKRKKEKQRTRPSDAKQGKYQSVIEPDGQSASFLLWKSIGHMIDSEPGS